MHNSFKSFFRINLLSAIDDVLFLLVLLLVTVVVLFFGRGERRGLRRGVAEIGVYVLMKIPELLELLEAFNAF